ncbi:LysR family transcriptional regulator [Vibrio caribbeanicus]|uniref:LysR family transcriptional regulator n=1 Tax=Vibrio caribbeanicus TaxID=701175 RepID=UPI0030D8A85A
MQAFNTIPIFVAVVECGSFSAAASKLCITKSAVSKRINLLEEELGTRLLNRTTRKLSLTEAGFRYHEYVIQSLSLAKQGIDAVSELQGQPRGTLKVTVPMSFGIAHITPFISEFLALYPDVDINLSLEDRMLDLVQEGFDIGIRIGDLPDSNLIARRLTSCSSVLCASANYLKKNPPISSPEDLKHHDCIQYSYYQGGCDWVLAKESKRFRILPKGRLSINNSQAIRQATINGAGIANLPTFIVADDLKSGRLQVILGDYQLPQHGVYAVFPDKKHMPLKVRKFLNFMIDKVGHDTPYWEEGILYSTKKFS